MFSATYLLFTVLLGAIVNRTYGTHKTFGFTLFHSQYLVLFTVVSRTSTAQEPPGKTVRPTVRS